MQLELYQTQYTNAVLGNEFIAAKKLLDQHPNINKNPIITVDHLLHSMVFNENIEAIKFLVNTLTPEEINKKDIYGRTALHFAVKQNNLKIVKLLARKETVNEQDFTANTPLHVATIQESYNMEIIETLLKCMAKAKQNNQGKTPFDCAKTPEVRDLLATYGHKKSCMIQ